MRQEVQGSDQKPAQQLSHMEGMVRGREEENEKMKQRKASDCERKRIGRAITK
jgi:hypothetical protein